MEILALETKNLSRSFGSQKAVDKVCMHVPKGCVYGLVGRNGAGKTTIMKMITNLMSSTSGEILIDGDRDLSKKHKVVGTLIEAPGIMPNLSAFDNVYAKCCLMGVEQPKKQAKELITALKLEDTGKKAVKDFSLGMRQRVGIALAFCGWPSIVLLDEPINALDPQGILEVREFINKIKREKNMTIVISSHLLDELGKVADYFGVIDHGKLVKEMSKDELVKLSSTLLKLRVDDKEKAQKLLEGYSDVKIEKDFITLPFEEGQSGEINRLLMNSGVKVYEVSSEHMDTEEIFLKIMGGENYA